MPLDPRVVNISIEVDGRVNTYSDLNMYATGMKYANPLQNEAEIKISNLDKETQNYILTQVSPFTPNRTPKTVIVEAGRKSTGVTTIYKGNIATCSMSQPPDQTITLKCLTGNFQKGNIISQSQPGKVTLLQASQQLANDLGYILDFQAQNKDITNFFYSGAAAGAVDNLALTGGISVFIDDQRLIVADMGVPINNIVRELNANTGMIGVPQTTELGVNATFLLDNLTRVGSTLRIKSDVNPMANGDFVIYKLGFEIATRDVPFYYRAEAAYKIR
jgi:hypothetical protein